jgi:hypothetical protein
VKNYVDRTDGSELDHYRGGASGVGRRFEFRNEKLADALGGLLTMRAEAGRKTCERQSRKNLTMALLSYTVQPDFRRRLGTVPNVRFAAEKSDRVPHQSRA